MLSQLWRPPVALTTILFFVASGSRLFGYALEGPSWPEGSTVNVRLAFAGPGSGVLQDGFTTFNASAANALALWNWQIDLAKFSWTVSSSGGSQRDGQNTAFFSSTVYGQSYGPAIAVTVYFYNGSTMLEADNLFNSALLWDSYRGPLQYNFKKGKYVYDFHRVAIHEFGHTLGLAHPDDAGQVVTAIMNRYVSDLDHYVDDDIAGAKSLYGYRITSLLTPGSSAVGETFSYQITANNNPASFSATGLPPGLSINTDRGVISGTPTSSGTFHVAITAIGPTGNATASLQLIIKPPTLLDLFTAPVQIGDSYSYQVRATSHPTSYDATGLPGGLQIDRQTGVISGVTIVAGNFNVNLTAHTPYGDATGVFLIQVLSPWITSDLDPNPDEVGEPLSYSITASNNPINFRVTGLPDGLQLNSATGIIHGTPLTPGSYSVTVIAHGTYADATGTLTFVITPREITSATGGYSVPIGSSFTYKITADNQPTSFSAYGLPSGLTLNTATGAISGVVTLSGALSFGVVAHGDWGDASATVTVQVEPLPTGVPPLAYFQQVTGPVFITDPQRPRLYAITYSGLLVIDTTTLSILQTIPITRSYGDLTISADGSQLLMATDGYSFNYHAIDRVALQSLTFLPSVPLTFPPNQVRAGLNSRLYVTQADNFTNHFNIYQVDGATGAIQRTVWQSTEGSLIEISPDRRTLYAAAPTSNGLPTDFLRLDVSGAIPLKQEENNQLGDRTTRLLVSNTGRYLCIFADDFSAPPGTAVRSAFNFKTILGRLGSFLYYDLCFNWDDSTAYGGDYSSSTIDFYDPGTFQLLFQLQLGFSGIAKLAVNNTNSTLFVYSESYPSGLLAYPAKAKVLVTPPHSLTNVSTRTFVGGGDAIAIGGFIIKGTQNKRVLLRALGPTLGDFGVTGAMPDPILELHDSTGALVASNDNWNFNRESVLASGLAPANEHESVIIATLAPGSYTAVLRGLNRATGVALCELYDLDAENSMIANISTRGNVGNGDNVMIAGFIVGGDQPTRMIVRALGPTLTGFGVSGALADPTLELHNANGAIIGQNDNWKSTQQSAIENSGYAPPKDTEAAIMATLQPGNYTAIVRGKNNTTGVALVEVYNLDAN